MYKNTFLKTSLLIGLASYSLMLLSCDASKVVGELAPPSSELNRVDLVSHPNIDKIGRYACHEWIGGFLCDALGNKPGKDKMIFSFDVVFDLTNNNEKVPIPLVEVLLGVSVYDDQNLGAVCISFCDPDETDCTPTTNAEDGCLADEGEEAKDISELFPPPLEDLAQLAESVVTGDFDNNSYRVIEAQNSLEAHIQFQFDVDTMLDLSEEVFMDAGEDLLADRAVSVDIPYALEGSLFFDIPELGRYAIGFGPWEDTWTIE